MQPLKSLLQQIYYKYIVANNWVISGLYFYVAAHGAIVINWSEHETLWLYLKSYWISDTTQLKGQVPPGHFVNSVYKRNSIATLQIFFLLRKGGDFFRLSYLICPFSMYQTEAALTPEYILNWRDLLTHFVKTCVSVPNCIFERPSFAALHSPISNSHYFHSCGRAQVILPAGLVSYLITVTLQLLRCTPVQ